MLSALLPLILGSTVLGNFITYNIYSKCPKPIEVEITDTTIHKFTLDPSTGYPLQVDAALAAQVAILIGTRAAEYSDNASIVAGFFGDFYSLAVYPTHLNTGVRVVPAPSVGVCDTIECDGPGCPGTTVIPLSKEEYILRPHAPIYQCNDNPAFDITFCPTGQYPGHDGLPIKFSSDGQTKCLDVQGDVFANGTLVQLSECLSTGGQRWVISKERVQIAGTNYCLTYPVKVDQLGIWQCFDPALPVQEWIYTADRQVALKGQGFCMGVENGRIDGGKVQAWQCTADDSNQIWSFGN